MIENNNIENELEQMRSQMSALKSKLDEQAIVNDKLIIESMKSKMSWIKKFIYIEMAIIPVIAVIWIPLKAIMNFSWLSFAVMMIAIIADVALDYYVNVHAIKDVDYRKDNMLQTVQKLITMKRLRFIQVCIGLPLMLFIVVWIGFEVYANSPHTAATTGGMWAALIGGIIGMIIGGGIGLSILRKMQKTNDEIIRQIEDLMKE